MNGLWGGVGDLLLGPESSPSPSSSSSVDAITTFLEERLLCEFLASCLGVGVDFFCGDDLSLSSAW